MKRIIRLTEGDLHKIVKESVNRILREEKKEFISPLKRHQRNGRVVGKLSPEELESRMKPTKGHYDKSEKYPTKEKSLGANAKGFDKLKGLKFDDDEKKKVKAEESYIRDVVDDVLMEANFFGGLRRAWNHGTALDYLTDRYTRNLTKKAVDIDKKRGLSGYGTKKDRRKMDADLEKMEADSQAARERVARAQRNARQPEQEKSGRGDIYSQAIAALNSGNYRFFNGRKELQGVLASLYNNNQISHNEYEKGLEWIGLGYRYPSGQSDGLY